MGKYKLCEGKTKLGNRIVASYGVVLPDGEIIGDVTFKRQSAEKLVGLLNLHSVETCHARDVIENFMFEETTLLIKFYGE